MDESLDDRIKRHGLARVAETLKANIKKTIQFKAKRVDEMSAPVGISKLGGMPDLPASVEWPTGPEAPMAFIAQINTSELPDVPGKEYLPKDYLLSFFLDVESLGNDLDQRCWNVIASALDSGLARRQPPKNVPEEGRFRACRYMPSVRLSLPSLMSEIIENLELDRKEDLGYEEIFEELSSPEQSGFNHQLFGYAREIQDDVDPTDNGASGEKTDWRLLLQVDSDDEAEMEWADGGRLYFWILDTDLRAQKFDNVWMVIQFF